MSGTIAASVNNEEADIDFAEHRKLNGFLEETLLSFAQANFTLVRILDTLDFFDSFFAHWVLGVRADDFSENSKRKDEGNSAVYNLL